LTLLCMSQRYRCAMCSQVRFPHTQKNQCFETLAKIFDKGGCTVVSLPPLRCTEVSLTLLLHAQHSRWHHCDMHSVSLTLPWHAQRCHWHCCATNCQFSPLIRSHIQKPVCQRLKGKLFDEKTRGRKSLVMVPLRNIFNIHSVLAVFAIKYRTNRWAS
jgi:hypothetical protein